MEAGAEIRHDAIIVRVIIQPSHQQNQQRVQINLAKRNTVWLRRTAI